MCWVSNPRRNWQRHFEVLTWIDLPWKYSIVSVQWHRQKLQDTKKKKQQHCFHYELHLLSSHDLWLLNIRWMLHEEMILLPMQHNKGNIYKDPSTKTMRVFRFVIVLRLTENETFICRVCVLLAAELRWATFCSNRKHTYTKLSACTSVGLMLCFPHTATCKQPHVHQFLEVILGLSFPSLHMIIDHIKRSPSTTLKAFLICIHIFTVMVFL